MWLHFVSTRITFVSRYTCPPLFLSPKIYHLVRSIKGFHDNLIPFRYPRRSVLLAVTWGVLLKPTWLYACLVLLAWKVNSITNIFSRFFWGWCRVTLPGHMFALTLLLNVRVKDGAPHSKHLHSSCNQSCGSVTMVTTLFPVLSPTKEQPSLKSSHIFLQFLPRGPWALPGGPQPGTFVWLFV